MQAPMRAKSWQTLRIVCLFGIMPTLTAAGCAAPQQLRRTQPGPAALPMAGEFFLAGVNYPWHKCGHDFGSTRWGHEGVSSRKSYPEVEADFAYFEKHQVQVIRWFVFSDGRASPEFDG